MINEDELKKFMDSLKDEGEIDNIPGFQNLMKTISSYHKNWNSYQNMLVLCYLMIHVYCSFELMRQECAFRPDLEDAIDCIMELVSTGVATQYESFQGASVAELAEFWDSILDQVDLYLKDWKKGLSE